MIFKPVEFTGEYTTGIAYKEEYVEDLKEEIERLKNTLKDIEEYINFLVIFNQPINGKFSETIWGQEILSFIEDSDKE